MLLRTTALKGAVTFERRAQLNGATSVLDYAVENRSGVTQSLLYCARPCSAWHRAIAFCFPRRCRM